MSRGQFRLGILGLSPFERTMIASVCSLTRSRARGYVVLPEDRHREADITVVDADDTEARTSWRDSQACRTGRPALMLASNPSNVPASIYCLPRNNFAARLLKMLDRITIRELKYLPELVVGEAEPAATVCALLDEGVMSAAPGAPRALVVDDSAAIRARLELVLQLHGLEVDLAPDAETALRLVNQQRYAVVLLDVVLPGIDGYAACRQLRAKAGDPSLPVVMLTGRDSTFDRVRGAMAGCTRYLTKPVDAEELRNVLGGLITGPG